MIYQDISKFIEMEIKAIEGVANITMLPVEVPELSEDVSRAIASVDKALGRDTDMRSLLLEAG